MDTKLVCSPHRLTPREPREREKIQMPEKINIEVWVVMDEDGYYAVGCDRDEAIENFENQIGGGGPRRVVKRVMRMAPPVVEEGPEIDIPDNAGEIEDAADEAEAA